MGENAFTNTGFQNWRKAMEKFKCHESSQVHREAYMKWTFLGHPTIEAQMRSHSAQVQMTRRQGILAQLRAIVFLTRQGIALRGHVESEGNLTQLLLLWSKDNNDVQMWLRENRYTSHQAVNELIDIFGLHVLRKVLATMRMVTGPTWYSIIADEASDVINTEQLNLSIRWVSDSYEAHEDSVGLF